MKITRAHTTLCLLLATLLACGSGEAPQPDPSAEAPAKAEPAPPEPSPDPVEVYAAAFIERLPELIAERRAQEQLLRALARDAREVVASARDPYAYRSILRRLYVRDDAPGVHFVRGGALTEQAREALAWLAEMHHHGVEAESRYHVARLTRLSEALSETPELKPLDLPEVDDAARRAVTELFRGGGLPRTPEARRADDRRLLNQLLGDASPWPALAKAVQSAAPPLSKERAKQLAEVEAFLVDGVARYAWDMRFSNEHRFKDEMNSRMKRRQRRRLLRNKLRDAVEEAVQRPDLVDWMKSLVPAHPQYARLIEALKRYRAIEAAGGWGEPRRVIGLRKGLEHAAVSQLKKRLALEGYHPVQEEYTDEYDDAAVEAVTRYQETHQIEVTGKPHKVFWRSLAVSLEERIAYITITLQRWRESNILDPMGYYVFVNIADFHLEVWKGGERLLRFKTVSGNTQWGCNSNNKRWIHINQTPIQASAIENIVVNPWWAVPERIRVQEILPAVARDPGYWDFHNFHCAKKVDGECVDVRQGAGKRNALGKLKFLFPSPYNTFLHDTPKKHFFKKPIRALSHGCVRLEKPVELAKLLLKEDGSFDEADWERYFDAKHRHTYNLKTPVPIFIEYYTVRVDDDDRVHFLADIYQHDEYRMRGRRFSPRKCTSAELEHAVNPYTDDGSD